MRSRRILIILTTICVPALLGLGTLACKASPPGSRPPTSGKVDDNAADLWIGTVDGELTDTFKNLIGVRGDAVQHYTTHMEVQLREHDKRPIQAAPLAKRTVGWSVYLYNEGTRVEASSDDGTHSDRATTTYSDEFACGEIWWRTIADDDAKSIGDYTFMGGNMKWEDVPMEGLYKASIGHLAFDRVDIGMGDGVNSESLLGPPPSYHHLNAAHTRMTGSYDVTRPYNDGSGGFRHLKVSWDICKQGSVDCIQAPPTAPVVDPCGSTANQDSLWQNCLDQENAIEKEIGALKKVQQKEAAEAQSHFADFKLVKNLCKLWDKTKVLLEAIIGGPDFLAGLSPADAAEFKEFQETIKLLTEMADKAADGKNPMEAMEPEQIKDWVDKGEKLNKLIEQLDILLAGYTPESGAKVLEDCSAPISDDLQRSAEQYVKHLKASLDQLHEINRRLNNLRSKDVNECLKRQWDAYSACVQHARCAGTPESACANKKPPGNWPDVR
jgi:hypothetical protein